MACIRRTNAGADDEIIKVLPLASPRSPAKTPVGLRTTRDAPPVIRKRLGVARQEIAQWKNFDYLIISTSIQEDLRRMQAIFDAENMRVNRCRPWKFDPIRDGPHLISLPKAGKSG